jgi:hypothetical protein
LDVNILKILRNDEAVNRQKLIAMAVHNSREKQRSEFEALEPSQLFREMVKEQLFRIIIVISGQGPSAFGMPEMFTPMAHINANQSLHQISALISDGRYSGTTFGAAIGHVTPEAISGGWIGLLKTGDLLRLRLSDHRLDLIDPEAADAGEIRLLEADLGALRRDLGRERCRRILERRLQIAATNRLSDVTDASRGVVPNAVAEEATEEYSISNLVQSHRSKVEGL